MSRAASLQLLVIGAVFLFQGCMPWIVGTRNKFEPGFITGEDDTPFPSCLVLPVYLSRIGAAVGTGEGSQRTKDFHYLANPKVLSPEDELVLPAIGMAGIVVPIPITFVGHMKGTAGFLVLVPGYAGRFIDTLESIPQSCQLTKVSAKESRATLERTLNIIDRETIPEAEAREWLGCDYVPEGPLAIRLSGAERRHIRAYLVEGIASLGHAPPAEPVE